jgi:agmatinase
MDLSPHLGPRFAFAGTSLDPAEARVVVFGVPLASTSSMKGGAQFGPNAIREASLHLEEFSPTKRKELWEHAAVADAGDIVVSRGDISKALSTVTDVTQHIAGEGKIPFMLGGEHTITAGAIRAFPVDTVLLWFDAHADLRERLDDDTVCHATAAKRALDYLPDANLIEVGVRSLSVEEDALVRKNRIKLFTTSDVRKDDDLVARFISEATTNKNVYVSVDVDVLDSKLVPGTGTPEPGGLEYNELVKLLSAVRGKVVGMDIVEAARDAEMMTAVTAARLAYEMLFLL